MPLAPPGPPPLALWGVGPGSVQTVAQFLVWVTIVIVPVVLLWHARRRPPAARRVLALVALLAATRGVVYALQALAPLATGIWADVAAAAIGLVVAVIILRRLPPGLTAIEAGRREEDLERLRLLEAAVLASGDGVMIADASPAHADGPQIVYANPAFERMMGYSAEEAVGLSPSIFCHSDTADNAPGQSGATEAERVALESVRAALRGTEPVRLELPNRRKDGTRVWAEWQVVPVADAAGQCTHWVAVLRDTTERRHLEEQLRESQKMDAVGRLAGGIAHDFNNLLTVIRGNAEMLRDAGPEVADAGSLVEDIRGAADRAAGLVRQLLAFSRRQPARPEVVDLNAVVTDMAGLLGRLLGERVAVAAHLAPAPVRARVDKSQLEQVVMNLAVNARDAMPKGGTLTISTAALTEPRPGSLPPARHARLSVSDTGTGMTPEVRAKIFEPFFTTKGPGKGTGLGLATVYGIVTQGGGRVGVESVVGMGTTFRVDLPWCDDLPAASACYPVAGVVRDRQAGTGRAVLLVEDEDGVRKLARAALEASGYAVTAAADGETAIDLLAPGLAVDVLVTDLTMPGMGGRELAARVRSVRPDAGVVFISGYAPDAGWLDGVPGAVFLAKPFTPADLLKAVSRAATRAAKKAVAVV